MALPIWQKLLLGSGILLVVGWGISAVAGALGDAHSCPRLTPPKDVEGGEVIDVDFERA